MSWRRDLAAFLGLPGDAGLDAAEWSAGARGQERSPWLPPSTTYPGSRFLSDPHAELLERLA